MKPLTSGFLAAVYLCAVAAGAGAQGASSRITFDATIGPSVARTTGPYREFPNDVALDALLGLRVRAFSRGAVFAAMNVGTYSGWRGTDLDCIPVPGYGCAPKFPTFEMAGALVGWQDARAIIRASTGAAYVQADWEGWSVAWQSRVDLAIPVPHVAPVMSVRATVVPNYPNGDTFRLFALGLGVRVH